ncbi:DUF4302 domain-containing protein [Pedobacter petrophilus]|uniref:DUF4302 domain-containing protein n=1 Tax=Pedobacter petrophilus TaxID=1908241 RepID=A0A7K0FXF9_9SPHI|nr:DUF4302 domain-containing protein [Pedobacter petrophilus]MRX76111.1 DUF4302 domain-containing protein [Pedobacter petrophilus]
MKKILIYTLLSLALFTGCKKEEVLIDGQRPEERVSATVTKYNNELIGSTNGWKAFLYPEGGGGYSFYFNFTKDNKVNMYADIDYDLAVESMESTYRIKAQQNPTLSFDTYSYMHILADPDPNTFGGVAGWGVYSDFEFTFDKQVGDSIMLTGKLLKSKLVLVKATLAEKNFYDSKEFGNSISDIVNYIDFNGSLYFTLVDAVKVQTSINYSQKVVTLIWDNGNGGVSTTATGFAFTLNGIRFKERLLYKGKSISELTWDPVKQLFFTTVEGTRLEVLSSPTGIYPLHLLIGIQYSAIIVPNGTSYPGWGTEFITRRAAAAAGTLASGYNLRLDQMAFVFNTINNTMLLSADVYQGANRFIADFPYTFTKTTAGVYKFTASAPTGNAALIVTQMGPLTTQRINTDTFTLEYFNNPITGENLGQFRSVQNPNFTFSGSLF